MPMFFVVFVLFWVTLFDSSSHATQKTFQKLREHEQKIVDGALALNNLIASHCPVCTPLTLPVALGITTYEIATTYQKQSVIFSNNWILANRCLNNKQGETSECKEILDVVCQDQCTRFRCLSPRISEQCQKLCATPQRAKWAKTCSETKTVWGQLKQCGPVQKTKVQDPELERATKELAIEESAIAGGTEKAEVVNEEKLSTQNCTPDKRKKLCLFSCTGVGPSPTCADEDIKAQCRQYCPESQIKLCLNTQPGTSWHRAIQCREAQDVLEEKLGKTIAQVVEEITSGNKTLVQVSQAKMALYTRTDPQNYYVNNEEFCQKNYKAACKSKCTKYACSDALVKEQCKKLCDVDETVKRNRTGIAKFFGADTQDKTLREYAATCLAQKPGCIVK